MLRFVKTKLSYRLHGEEERNDMTLEFCTKRNTYGNRLYLGINTDCKTFSINRHGFYNENEIQVSKAELKAIRDKLQKLGFFEVDYI